MPDTNKGIIMKQKFFLFIIVALCSVTSAWACDAPIYGAINSLPTNTPCYITNVSYNVRSGELTFNDSFMPSASAERRYEIHAYYRDNTSTLYQRDRDYNCRYKYEYGHWESSNNYHSTEIGSATLIFSNSNGGYVSSRNSIWGNSVQELIESCYAQGYTQLCLAIDAYYLNPITQSSYISYITDEANDFWRVYLITLTNIDLPSIRNNSLSVPQEVKYGGDRW